jgi:glutaconate CoA-transferase, subunit A
MGFNVTSKFVSIQEAVQLIANGSIVAISGNMDMSPMALIREIVRAKKRKLQLVCVGSAAINADLLIAARSVSSVEYSQISFGEFGFAPHFRKNYEAGLFRSLEHACPSLISAIQAGAMGVPFIPVRGLIGTDYMKIRSDFKVIRNPYDAEEELVIVPSISPETAIFHAYKADMKGNVVAHASQNNRLLAQASQQTLVTVEEIVSEDELRLVQGTFIPAEFLSAIVLVPFGAHPTGCPGHYGVDSKHIRTYVTAAQSETSFSEYVKQFIIEPLDHTAYLHTVHDQENTDELFER